MGQLTDMINKYKSVNIRESVRNAFLETQEHYVDLNLEQMYMGDDRDGGAIGTYALPPYAAQKARMNPLPGIGYVDLYLTGAFYRGVYVSLSGSGIVSIQSIDFKNDELIGKYGEKIFGLMAKNRTRFIFEFFKPSLVKKIAA